MENAASVRVAPFVPMLAQASRCEFWRLVRVPAFSIPVIAFPVLFFALFGLPYAHDRIAGVLVGSYTLASFGAYAIVSVALFSFGITVANDRGERTTVLMRATPLHPLAYLGGKVIATLAMSAITLVALFGFGALVGGVHLGAAAWFTVVIDLLAGVFPFITLGFAIGYLFGPNSAGAVLQIINLPMSFASGLFVPLPNLPGFVRAIAPFLPTYHLGQLAWGAVGAPVEPRLLSLVWLAGYTIAFMAIAVRAYYREETKTFG
jgi:ABC-2 type transport system permease protein